MQAMAKTGKPDRPHLTGKTRAEIGEQERRLAVALRANLRKRRQQTAARAAAEAGWGGRGRTP